MSQKQIARADNQNHDIACEQTFNTGNIHHSRNVNTTQQTASHDI